VLLQAPITPEAVRDTIARIVLERGYRRTLSSTLLSRAMDWLGNLIRDLFQRATASRGTYIVALGVIAVIAITAIMRAIVLARARRRAALERESEVTAAQLQAEAKGLAEQGAYPQAANVLYTAVVMRLTELKRVRRHPSKTVGDYWRELRSVGDDQTAAYAAFARVYEIVAYGDKLCDASRYAHLEQLSASILTPSAGTSSARAA
jgi:type II secretory pathway pseudopilin PulG